MNEVKLSTTLGEIAEEMAVSDMSLSMQTITYADGSEFVVVLAQEPMSGMVRDLVHRLGARMAEEEGVEIERHHYEVDS